MSMEFSRSQSTDSLSEPNGVRLVEPVRGHGLSLNLGGISRLRSLTPTPVSTARSPRESQLEQQNHLLERHLHKVEEQLAEAHAERDQLLSRVQALTERLEMDVCRGASPTRVAPVTCPLQLAAQQKTAAVTCSSSLRENSELRRRLDEERAEFQRRTDQAQAIQARQRELVSTLQLDVGRLQERCQELELQAARRAEPPVSGRRRSVDSASALSTVVSAVSNVESQSTAAELDRERQHCQTLAQQLDLANRSNQRLQTELQRLRAEIDAERADRERFDAETVQRERALLDANAEANDHLTEIWRYVSNFRKSLNETRLFVDRQLAAPRNELAKLRENLSAVLASFAANQRANEQKAVSAQARELKDAKEAFERQLREIQAASEKQLADMKLAIANATPPLSHRASNQTSPSPPPVVQQPDALRAIALDTEALQRTLRELAQMVLQAGASEQAAFGDLEDDLAFVELPPSIASSPCSVVESGTRTAYIDHVTNVVRQALQRRQARLAAVARAIQTNRSALQQARSSLDELTFEKRSFESRLSQLQGDVDNSHREANEMRAECDKLRKQIAEVKNEREKLESERLASHRSRELLERRTKEAEARVKESHEALERVEEELSQRRTQCETQQRLIDSRSKQFAELDERAGKMKEELLLSRETLRKCELDRDLLESRRAELEETIAAGERARSDLEAGLERLRADLDRSREAAQKLNIANEQLEGEKHSLEAALVRLEAASTRVADEKRRTDIELGLVREEVNRLVQQIASLETDKQKLTVELSGLRTDLTSSEDQVRRVNREKAELIEKLNVAAQQKGVAADELGRLRAELERLQGSLASVLEEKTAAVGHLERAHSSLRELESQLQRAVDETRSLHDEKLGLEAALADSHDLVTKLDSRRVQLENQLSELSERRSAIERQLANLSDQHAAELHARDREKQTFVESLRELDLCKARLEADLRRSAEENAANDERLQMRIVEVEKSIEAKKVESERLLQDAAARFDADRTELVHEIRRIAQSRDIELSAAEQDREQLRNENAALSDRLRAAERDRLAAAEEIDHIRAEMAQREAVNQQIIAGLERHRSEIAITCEDRDRQLQLVGAEMLAVRRECDEARFELEAMEQRVRGAEQQRDAARREAGELARERASMADAIARLEREVNETRASLAEATRERDLLERSINDMCERVRACEARRNEAERTEQEAMAHANASELKATALAGELAALREATRSDEQRIAVITNEAAELRRIAKLAETEVAGLSSQLEETRSMVGQRDRIVEQMRHELVTLRQRASDAEGRSEAFRAELHAVRNSSDERDVALNGQLAEMGIEMEQLAAAKNAAEDTKVLTITRVHELEDRAQSLAAELMKVDSDRQSLEATLARADRERRDLEFKVTSLAAAVNRLLIACRGRVSRPSSTKASRSRSSSRERDDGDQTDRLSAAEVNVDDLRDGLRLTARQFVDMEREKESLAVSLAQAQARLAERSREVEAMTSRLQSLETRLAELNAANSALSEAHRDDEARLVSAQNETLVEREKLMRVERELAAAAERVATLDAANRQLSEQERALAQSYDECQRANLELRSFADELEQQVRFIEQLRANLDNDLQRCELAMRERDAEIRSLQDRLDAVMRVRRITEVDVVAQKDDHVQQLSLQLARSNAVVHELENQLAHSQKLESVAVNASASATEEMHSQLTESHAALAELRNRLAVLERERISATQTIEQNAVQHAELLARVHAAEADRQTQAIRYESLEKKLAVLELQRQRLEHERDTLLQRVEHANELRERLAVRIRATQQDAATAFEERLRELADALLTVEQENTLLVQRTQQLEAALSQSEAVVKQELRDDAEAREAAYRSRVLGLEKIVDALRDQLEEELSRRSRAEQEVRAIRASIDGTHKSVGLPATDDRKPSSESRKLNTVQRREAALAAAKAAVAMLGGSQTNLASRYLGNSRPRTPSPPRHDNAELIGHADNR